MANQGTIRNLQRLTSRHIELRIKQWSLRMNARFNPRLLLVLSVLFLLAMACSLPTSPQENPPATNAQTQAVQTLNVLMTQVAQQNATATPGGSQPTNTPQVPTLLPSSTPQPTASAVIIPSPTVTKICDQAAFVTDVNIPDGSILPAGTQFSKTWRLKNTGTCTWTPEYSIVLESGDAMSGPASQKINASVVPGQTIDVSVPLKAPGQPGSYRGYWKMRNAAGVVFGVGKSSDRFYVDIKVISITPASGQYDFTANYCLAEWTGNGKVIACQGTDGNSDGFVLYKAQPILETGYVDDQPALITNPPLVTDGVIRGKFPPYTVSAKDHFETIIGCENNAKNCNVRFQLDYQIDDGTIKTLASWNELYDNNFTKVNVDLSSLAGSNVKFILTVLANGASDNDRAQWLLPRIVKQ
jgi:hypothetical protein